MQRSEKLIPFANQLLYFFKVSLTFLTSEQYMCCADFLLNFLYMHCEYRHFIFSEADLQNILFI